MNWTNFDYKIMWVQLKEGLYGFPNLDFFVSGIIVGFLWCLIMAIIFVKWFYCPKPTGMSSVENKNEVISRSKLISNQGKT